MKRSRKRVWIIVLSVILIVIAGIIIWFKIPFSPLKRAFNNDIERLMKETSYDDDLFRDEDIEYLPEPVQRYIRSCGYIGTPKMDCLMMEYHDVSFKQGRDGPDLVIDYYQYDFVNEPARAAFIDSSMFGIPFQGYDYYTDGVGGMKGVIAKSITIFDTTGPEMDRACLVTYLAESPFAPAILLSDLITWKEINDYEAEATITYKGQTVSGIFRFNEQYEYIEFSTNDRAVSEEEGTVPWSAVCEDYKMSDNGIKYPSVFKAIWHYPDGDFVYFDGGIDNISYDNELHPIA